jgi:dihydrofolate reductase
MVRLRVHNLSISLDGFAAGEPQTLETPMGHATGRLHEWMIATATFQERFTGRPGGTEGVDDALAAANDVGIGAEIMGRRKFGWQTGPWEDESWRGWWGEEPPFHTPVVVLTHHPRPDLVMEGGTTFTFLDAEPAEALRVATGLAGGLDVRLGGGAATVREFLDADLVDHLHVAVVPIVLGRGSRLWDGQEGLEERFDVETSAAPSGVVHHVFTRRR